MAADLEQFQQLLTTLLSTDNDARTQAEVCTTSANLVAARGGRRSRRQEREYTRNVRRGTLGCRARCRCVVRALACGCCNGAARAIRDAFGSSGNRDADRSEENSSSRGDPEDFDPLTSVSARAIGQEIQNGVLHAGSARARAFPSVIGPACSGKRVSRRRRMSRVTRISACSKTRSVFVTIRALKIPHYMCVRLPAGYTRFRVLRLAFPPT